MNEKKIKALTNKIGYLGRKQGGLRAQETPNVVLVMADDGNWHNLLCLDERGEPYDYDGVARAAAFFQVTGRWPTKEETVARTIPFTPGILTLTPALQREAKKQVIKAWK